MTTAAEITGAQAPAGASASANPDLRWYIVHAYSGMEKAVERNIQERSAALACKTNSAAFWCRPKKSLK